MLNNTALMMGAQCTLTGDPGQPFTSQGIISTQTNAGYLLTPLLESRVTALMGQEAQRTIQLHGADVSLEVKSVTVESSGGFSNPTVTLPDNLAKFSSLFSGSLKPAGTVNVGFDIMSVQTIRTIQQLSGAAATDKLNAEVLATITIYGDLGGSTLKALPFQYPVTVCNDCVVIDHGACPMTVASIHTGNPCQVYQDGQVDCCHDAANNLICPGYTQ